MDGPERVTAVRSAGMAVRASDVAVRRSQLRFITCGSVDDGKSTLIGRMLYDAGCLRSDEVDALVADSRPDRLDFSLLVDGLSAEREQGITIDVAYRYFSTPRRSFIVADAPGHVQYTRNMVTGASHADLAVILIDARKGVLTQTRRHTYLARLVGIRRFVLAINKMDLIGYDEETFAGIAASYGAFAAGLELGEVTAIPVSGLQGDNVAAPSAAMPWYQGLPLLRHLEEVETDTGAASGQFRMPVQWVNRPDQNFRGVAGTVSSGSVRPGEAVRICPSGRTSRIARIVTFDGDLSAAEAGRAVTLTFTDEVDCSRGAVIASAAHPVEVADQFEATLVWMADTPMLPGREYLIKIGTATVAASVSDIKHRLDIDTLKHLAARTLELNEVAVVTLSLREPVGFAPFEEDRQLGAFILIDRFDNRTIGAGTIHFALRRAHNIHWQHLEVDRTARAMLKAQQPRVLWFTGLSGAGKSTIANIVEKKLHAMGRHTFLLDGDNIRHRLNQDLGFTDADRVENIRRVGEVARLMTDAGLIVLTAFISPFRAERRMVRAMFPPGEFIEVFVDTPLDEAASRDPKGLYAKARRGELPNFTGIDSPYEPPVDPEERIDTTRVNAEAAADRIVERFFS